MDFIRKYSKELIVLTLVFSNVFVWISAWERRPSDILTVYFLNVGQGDAIFIDSPDHNRILIDGGKNRVVLSELGKILPFADRRIDVVLATHPDADHIGGLPEVVSRYKVEAYIESGREGESNLDEVLDTRLEEESAEMLVARRGMKIHLGRGVLLEILYPNENVSTLDPNDASIVAKLTYGQESFLFTGDAGLRTENILLNLDEKVLDTDVLKVGHHGSKTSTFLLFAQAVSPEYAIISAGKDNSYGHPHKDVIDRLKSLNAKILSTAELGTIKFETDGEVLYLK